MDRMNLRQAKRRTSTVWQEGEPIRMKGLLLRRLKDRETFCLVSAVKRLYDLKGWRRTSDLLKEWGRASTQQREHV